MIDFRPSRIDGAFWYRLRKDGSGYDYIASHVDDLTNAAENAEEIVKFLKDEFIIKDEALPDDYLGLTMKVTEDGKGWALKYQASKKVGPAQDSNQVCCVRN